jgi:hypothetical protein
MIRHLYPPTPGESLLSAEVDLLARIFRELIPNSLRLAVRHPVLAARRLFITAYIMMFVALGYVWPRRSLADTTATVVGGSPEDGMLPRIPHGSKGGESQ